MWERFDLVKGDITAQSTDAIVNPANHTLLGGGGIDGVIHRTAGPELAQECRILGGCDTGEAKTTKGYRLAAKYVIHTVGPAWRGGTFGESRFLRECYENCLEAAAEHGVRSIAFPSVATGAHGYPVKLAAPIALGTVANRLYLYPDLDLVRFVLYTNEDFLVYRRCFDEITQCGRALQRR